MTVFSAIIAAIKAVPAITALVEKFVDMWIDNKISNIENQFDIEREKLIILKRSIRGAKDDRERIALSIILNDYYSGKVQSK